MNPWINSKVNRKQMLEKTTLKIIINVYTLNQVKTMFVHASVRTSNMERSLDFYSHFLGLKLLSRREIKATNAEIAFLQDSEGEGCILELTHFKTQKIFSQPEYEERLFDHLGFQVADISKILVNAPVAG